MKVDEITKGISAEKTMSPKTEHWSIPMLRKQKRRGTSKGN